jgi:periplasmic protein TonB
MTYPVRIFGSMALAVMVTLGLFWFMQSLIAGHGGMFDRGDPPPGIRFGEVKVDDTLQVRERRIPPKPPPPKEPPPPPQLSVQRVDQVVSPLPQLAMPNLNLQIGGTGPFLGGFGTADMTQEGDIIPLVRIEPQYPRQAALARIEGWVEVEFTITETGSVSDPRVIRARPPRVFDREAIRAILRWRFKPRVVDGQPVPRQATQIIDFKLADD